MLMHGGNPQGGRDVMFRIRVALDPSAKAEVKKFGADLADAQKQADETMLQGAKRLHNEKMKIVNETAAGAERSRQKDLNAQLRQDKLIADNHLRTHLKRLDDEKKATAKMLADTAREHERAIREQQRMDKTVADNHLRTTLRALDEEKKAKAQSLAAASRAAEQAAERTLREQLRRDKQIADNHLRQHLRTLDAKERADRQAADRALREAEKHDRLLARSYLREHLQAIEEARRARERAARQSAGFERQSALARTSSLGGFQLAGRGVLGAARGLAYAGLVGEEDSQRLLDSLLKIEATFTSLSAGIDIWKGLTIGVTNYRRAVEASAKANAAISIVQAGGAGVAAAGTAGASRLGAAGAGTAAAGGSLYAGGAAAPIVAGAAALAALIAALTMLAQTIRDASKYGIGGGATPGSASDQVGSWIARFGIWLQRNRTEESGNAFVDAAVGERRLSTAEKSRERYLEGLAAETKQYAEISQRSITAANGNLPSLFRAGRQAMQDYQSASAGGRMVGREAAGQAVLAIETEIRRVIKEQQEAKLKTAREAVMGAERELSTLKEVAELSKRQADEARGNLRSDLVRFGQATAEEKDTLRIIADKRRRGERLTEGETEVASKYSEFQDFGEKSAIDRAKAAGADFLFTEGQRESERLAKDAATAADRVAKAEVTLKEKREIVVRIEQDTSLEKALRQEFERTLQQIKQDQQTFLQHARQELAVIQRETLNRRSP